MSKQSLSQLEFLKTIRSDDRYRKNPVDQANLFNKFFYLQFFDVSSYNIDINMRDSRNCFMDLQLHAVDVYLRGTNPSKALIELMVLIPSILSGPCWD